MLGLGLKGRQRSRFGRPRGASHKELMNASIFSKKLSDLSKGGVSLGRRRQNSPLKSSIARNQPMPSIGLKDTKEPSAISRKTGISDAMTRTPAAVAPARGKAYPSANEGASK